MSQVSKFRRVAAIVLSGALLATAIPPVQAQPMPVARELGKTSIVEDVQYRRVAKRRAGDTEDALDLFAAALEISPGQPDVLFEMAELFAARQNCKRALELVDMALPTRSHEPRFHAAKARYLHGLGRTAEAKVCLQLAFKVGLDSPDLRKVGRLLRRSRP